jgi:hypothetical protein
MIYKATSLQDPLMQGDLVLDCPISFLSMESDPDLPVPELTRIRVVILTQSCDLQQSKSQKVLVAPVYLAAVLAANGVFKPAAIRDQVRLHRVYGWYFLPAADGLPESIVDLRDLHTVPRKLLETLVQRGKRPATIATPYREHMAQHFAVSYSRIGLPDPYPTQADAQA